MSNIIGTIKDVISEPTGMARLVEGMSSLNRARDAELTNDQIRKVYTDLSDVSDDQLNGFISVGNMFISGEVRCKGKAFNNKNLTLVKT